MSVLGVEGGRGGNRGSPSKKVVNHTVRKAEKAKKKRGWGRNQCRQNAAGKRDESRGGKRNKRGGQKRKNIAKNRRGGRGNNLNCGNGGKKRNPPNENQRGGTAPIMGGGGQGIHGKEGEDLEAREKQGRTKN